MSGYNGRRGPNVSQYVANLNTLPTNQDLLEEPLDLETDLSIFTNSDFIEWDPSGTDLTAPIDFLDSEQQQPPNRQPASNSRLSAFQDFPGFQNPIVGQSMQSLPASQSNYPGTASFTSPVAASRRLDSVDSNSQPSTDEPARMAAEEDKRRRNTAASARFRVKKKQREQALEKTAKEMTDRVNMLESKIAQLETENTWLKGLITEKGASGTKASTSELSSMLKKRVDQNAGERSSGNRTDGVGTKSKDTKA
ncbi:hypothetical protein K505DRAFT_383639 [Melanomma pulvis-pyrius CBS 109.77]|uniref:BZIP domain-containing protein n=1 Tax=Melanomma pulvis-pyrius CBS 109.77 TaxID=1314802 RepID=A0A6A6XE05_9PLEO|nr:hypothetical protein K505DRAFT_383639 [Melanomma pulvis-pyrius CBS 109.77]